MGPSWDRGRTIGFSSTAAFVAVVLSLLIALAAYGVSKVLPATYQSNGLIRIALASQGGINDPVVTAANDIATQYAQLASSQPIATLAARKLGVPTSELNGKISGSTLGAQNLVQVSVTADSAATARTRAAAASAATAQYITRLNNQENAQYLARVQGSLSQVNAELSSLARRLTTDPPAQHATDSVLVESLSDQRAQLLGQVARDAASNQPTLQVVEASSTATVTSPKPKLYALVALVVALIITGRAAFVLSSRRTRV